MGGLRVRVSILGRYLLDLGKWLGRGHARGWAITKEARGGGTSSAVDGVPPGVLERTKDGGRHSLPRA